MEAMCTFCTSKALQCIFAFASFKDVTALVCVCRSWQTAVGCMPSLQLVMCLAPYNEQNLVLQRLCASLLRRHVNDPESEHDYAPLYSNQPGLVLLNCSVKI